MRRQVFAEQPVCYVCHVERSAILDHVVALSQGGADTPANYRGICVTCNKRKVGRESHAARRARGGRHGVG